VADRLNALVGRRVALRHRLPPVDGRPMLTDAVGELGEDGPAAVLVHTRRGVVRVERNAVVAVREIPPPMPRRPSWAAVARLERICADAWPSVVVRPLGQWRLRAAGGFTGRANSALVVGDPGLPVAEALREVRAFAVEHELAPRVQVAMGSPWQQAITAQGWTRDDTHPAGADVAVLVAELPGLAVPGPPRTEPAVGEQAVGDPAGSAPAADRAPGPAVGEPAAADLTGWLEPPVPVDGVALAIGEQPDEDWWRLTADHPLTRAQRHVLTAPGVEYVGYGVAREPDGEAVGVVRLAVVDGHLHVARLSVADGYRRRGVAVALMRAAAQWGMTRAGAQWCVLQVAEHNAPALGLYRRLGFRVHHRYQYLRPGSPTATST
jgi:ribosomal protein S18 acetylase RimI-like enzyme